MRDKPIITYGGKTKQLRLKPGAIRLAHSWAAHRVIEWLAMGRAMMDDPDHQRIGEKHVRAITAILGQ